MVATAGPPKSSLFPGLLEDEAEQRLCMCWIPHRWCVQGSGWLQLAMSHLRPDLLPLSYEYFGCRSIVS
jgi:hypothetical protein